jgi:hexosaminidase
VPVRRKPPLQPGSAPILVPPPRSLVRLPGAFPLPLDLTAALAGYTLGAPAPRGVRVHLDTGAVPWQEGYRLSVEPRAVTLVARDACGLFRGMMSLRQLARRGAADGVLPCLRIEDWPAFPVRGLMLDISRDRVPTMETLTRLIDLWAELKLNQLQLYTEHTFAYPSHRVVWRDASPVTPGEAEELDRYCADRGIELVPNQNSFGHMERWLMHDRYAPLADATEGFRDPWGGWRTQPTTLNPLDPRSIELVAGLYDELLPHFRSGNLNVGADEPIDLGHGRTRQACARRGVGRVYLEFLLALHEQVSRRGKVMQFWGDIVLHHRELIGELPRDVVALDWGYEATHPFEAECAAFAEAGLPFYVCPGTSSWNSLGGRWGNARANIDAAIRAGLAAGADGLLLTDWGDNGHWQQLPVSYPAWLYGASAAWNPEAAAGLDLEGALSAHLFGDETGKKARGLMLLEELYDDGILLLPNAGILAVLLLLQLQPYHEDRLEAYRGYDFSRGRSAIGEALRLLGEVQPRSGAHPWSEAHPWSKALAGEPGRLEGEGLAGAGIGVDETAFEELSFTADLMLHAVRLGAARFATPGMQTAQIPAADRADLAGELEELIRRYRRLWLHRSRPGGLEDSCGRMAALLASYRAR